MSHSNSIWSTLSAIDCNEHVEKKGQFSYLAWTWAVAIVRGHYPEMTHRPLEDVVYADGSMEVRCEVTIGDQTHPMWLPVTDFKNKAIQNPNAFDINTARMRCLVKNFAVNFGLGHYIYAGESMPQVDAFTADQKARYLALMAAEDGWGMKAFGSEVGNDVMAALFNDAPKGEKTKQKALCNKIVTEANGFMKAWVQNVEELITNGSAADAITETWEELNSTEQHFCYAAMDEVTRLNFNEATGVKI